MEITNNAYLPKNRASNILSGDCDIINNIIGQTLGVQVTAVPSDARLPAPVASHADIQCCSVSPGEYLTTSPRLASQLNNMGLNAIIIDETPGNAYPNDCLLNCFRIAGIIVCGRAVSKKVLDTADREMLKVVMVSQGYAKCSTALINEQAVITADPTIANALCNDFDVLKISSGAISLPGYSYGFIGGACGKISTDKMIFAGNPLMHPDGKEIVRFLELHQCEAVSLFDGQLQDFGGILTLFEE